LPSRRLRAGPVRPAVEHVTPRDRRGHARAYPTNRTTTGRPHTVRPAWATQPPQSLRVWRLGRLLRAGRLAGTACRTDAREEPEFRPVGVRCARSRTTSGAGRFIAQPQDVLIRAAAWAQRVRLALGWLPTRGRLRMARGKAAPRTRGMTSR